ncbi:MAG: 6-pyruvoyl tetrahydropterin synthase family protein [Theionarchaea archaeon]|nr:6-pyruvoyl tetrahydropterin synthase family protein [Theionarchaea archaeon]
MSNAIYRVEGSFSASHCLPDHSRCGSLHGHNYIVEIFLKSEISESSHLQVDLSALKHTLREVLEDYDHTHLNDKIPYPSCENIALSIISELKIRGITVHSVRVWETPLQWVEIIAGE